MSNFVVKRDRQSRLKGNKVYFLKYQLMKRLFFALMTLCVGMTA